MIWAPEETLEEFYDGCDGEPDFYHKGVEYSLQYCDDGRDGWLMYYRDFEDENIPADDELEKVPREYFPDLCSLAFNFKIKKDGRTIADYLCDYYNKPRYTVPISPSFVKDEKQNQATFSNKSPINLYNKAYAVCSKDLSADSKNNFECFNNSNILKARIYANRLQTEYDILVILTLIWGDETTYELAFGNVEKGSVVAISSQAIEYKDIFIKGFTRAVEKIQPEFICWYGNHAEFYSIINSIYDLKKIIPMQTRTQLIQQKMLWENSRYQLKLNFIFGA